MPDKFISGSTYKASRRPRLGGYVAHVWERRAEGRGAKEESKRQE